MKKAKYQTPLTRMARFKNSGEIVINFHGVPTWITFDEARTLRDYLDEMLDGDLVEVRQKDCGCLEKNYGKINRDG